MSNRIPEDDIKRADAVGLDVVVRERGLILRGRVEMTGSCPNCGGTDRFAVNTVKHCFNCRGCGAKGRGAVGLVMFVDSVGFREAVASLIGETATRFTQIRKPSASPDQHEIKQHRKARWWWSMRQPITGSPVERYLREKRGYAGPLPETLGYLPPSEKHPHPAMIAAFGLPDEPEPGLLDPTNLMVCGLDASVHITLLKPDGSDKADTQPNKFIIGRPLGRPIVLAPLNDRLGLAVCEGIEDGLSIFQATGLGVWAAYSAGNMPKLVAAIEILATAQEYDGTPECVTIFAHTDDAGQRNALALGEALHKRGGIEVLIEGLP